METKFERLNLNSKSAEKNQDNNEINEFITSPKTKIIYNNEYYTPEELSDKLHLSLILDDENKLSLDFSPTENIENFCYDICKKNHLGLLLAKKLKKKIDEQIFLFNKEKKNYISKNKEEKIVDRLYTQAVQNKKVKDEYFEKIKNDMKQTELNNYTFTPKISDKSNILYNRSHLKIEDKLFYEDRKKKEANNFYRLIKNINNRESYENKNISNSKGNIHNNQESKIIKFN